ncbi:ParB/RepB/Spo0J family partition protein [Jannaschia rubra]|uniref:ParB/RepB/Spo0J family partition protein n=1 Tax=Jannaschia rubra TaxID=282197 RepID=UPI002491A878|nr:ParB N-terminal domain-containing protein [Jannaschia rubra]
MSRKRRVFDVDLPEEPAADFPAGKDDLPAEYETKAMFPRRRGPMAAAIGETGDALRHRKQVEADIRAENDALAHEFVRLKREGLMVDRVPVEEVNVHRLVRDRSTRGDPDLDDLKTSLLAIGLSNPIRVAPRPGGGHDLIEGFRRLAAYKALLEETGDPRWARIPAALLTDGEGEGALYRRMVDENLVRKDISFAEMAALAIAYADDHVDGCADVDEAVNRLYASTSAQKRSYVRRFALLLRRMGKAIEHPEALPRALGLKLADLIEGDIDAMNRLLGDLSAAPNRDAATEGAILRAAVEGFTAAPKPRGAPKAARRGRVSLSVPVGPGARCTAADGKVEIRARMDFSNVPQDRLQAAIEAFFRELER